MREEKKVATVLRYRDYDGDFVYVGAVNENDYDSSFYINECYDAEGAMDFDGHSEEYIFNVFEQFTEEANGKEVELVRITTVTQTEDLMADDEKFKELRQKAALSKLSEAEIKALGLTSIAVYIKTKYHNA